MKSEKKPPQGQLASDGAGSGSAYFTLQQQAGAAWLLVRKFDHARMVGADLEAPLTGHRQDLLCSLLGREVQPGDLELQWTLPDAAYVAEHLIVALISGCVPLPRTKPLAIAELPGLVPFGSGCLPPCTSTPCASAKQ